MTLQKFAHPERHLYDFTTDRARYALTPPENTRSSCSALPPMARALPAEERARLGEVWAADFGVVLGEGEESEGGVAADEALDLLGELEDGHLGGVADVGGLAFGGHEQAVDAFDQVADVAEGTGLGAVAEDGQRLVAEGLGDERRDDAASLTRIRSR